jgi:aldehyde:ferredoxin oxidoreductase
MRGYAGKFIEVDLTNKSFKNIRISEDILRHYMGGRALAVKILWDRLGTRWEKIDPLGPENILLILTGPLTGFVPGARLCISGKSPQSNGIIGSTIAGEFPVELKCAGYDGIIILGKSEKPVYLTIVDSEIEIKDANDIWGKNAEETLKALVKREMEELEKCRRRRGLLKEPAVIYIGPAGEKLVRMATVNSKLTHAAGYGGYGAVMGSKNLKAVVVKGTGPLPEVYSLDAVSELIDKFVKINLRNNTFRRWGTAYAGYDVGARLSSEPIKNWQEEWHNEKGYGVDKFEKFWVKNYWGDFGCPITCLKIAVTKIGSLKGAITDNPDYENQAYLGTNLGIFKPEENIYLMSVIDELGLCGIQCGNVLGFTAELYERGILSQDDLNGIELKWGDVHGFAVLASKIANREGIGDILAEGTYRAAIKIKEIKGVDVLKYAVVEKGVAIGAHGIRSGQDYPSYHSYPCSVQGGDHTSIAYTPINHGNSELTLMLYDSAVVCWFNFFNEGTYQLLWDFIHAVTGWKVTPEEWYNVMARRVLHIQRAALLIGGPDLKWNPKIHDDIPSRWYEPLTNGPYAGKKIDKAKLEEAKKEYYDAVGWDENGIPKSEELKRLELDEVDEKLKEIGF